MNFERILQAPLAVKTHQVEIPQAAIVQIQIQLSFSNPCPKE